MRIILVLLLMYPLLAHAYTLEVVSEGVCDTYASKLRQCENVNVDLRVANVAEYIPLEMVVSVLRNSYCQTQYPISLAVSGSGGEIASIDVFGDSPVRVRQEEETEMRVSVVAPYNHVAWFDRRCLIAAEIVVDQVNRDELTQNLTSLKTKVTRELQLLDEIISDKTLIIDLVGALTLYANVLDIAEQQIATFNDLSAILVASCGQEASCSWTGQVSTIFDNPGADIPMAQIFLLYNLASSLDYLVPADCGEGNCVANLIDDDTRATLVEISNTVPSLDDLRVELTGYIAEKELLLDEVREYESVALSNGIDWDAL